MSTNTGSVDTSAKIGVFLIDEHPVARTGTEVFLSGNDRIRVVGEASSLEDALRRKPECDVVVMDIQPLTRAMRRLRGRLPGVGVLCFSGATDEASVRGAVTGGARGFLAKTASGQELVRAIEAVHSGGSYFTGHFSRLFDQNRDALAADESISRLTPRERQVLKEVASGYTSREIAERLRLSIRTVESHRERIMHKVGIHRASALTRFAIARGLVDAE